MGRLRRLHEEFKDQAAFLLIYVSEAPHPLPELGPLAVGGPDTDTSEVRRKRIGKGLEVFDLPFPCLLDEDGRVEAAYHAFPQRLVIVGSDGQVVLDVGRGSDGLVNAWDMRQIEERLRAALSRGSLH